MRRRSILFDSHTAAACSCLLAIALCLTMAMSAVAAPAITLKSANPIVNGNFGGTVASVPDIDGDGKPEILVAAIRERVGSTNDAGRVYIFSAAGSLIRSLESPAPVANTNGNFGFSMAGVPDINSDGKGDVIVGAARDASGAAGAGKAYLFSGADGTIIQTFSSPNSELNGAFGIAVATLPDLNNDGKSEFLIGAVSEDSATTNGGRAYVFSGTGSLITTLESPNKQVDGDFGARLTVVPDVDGDGKADYAIAGWKETVSAQINAGRVYVFSSASHNALLTLQSPAPRPGPKIPLLAVDLGNFGTGIAGLQDINNDGSGDVVVAAWLDRPPGSTLAAGAAYLFSGKDGVRIKTLASPNPEQNSITGNFGRAISRVQDLTGDNLDDIVIGAWGDDVPTTNTGRAYVFSAAGPSTNTVVAQLVSPNPKDTQTILNLPVYGNFGTAVAGLPSIFGNASGKVAVGAPVDLDSGTTAGMTYIFDLMPLVVPAGVKGWDQY